MAPTFEILLGLGNQTTSVSTYHWNDSQSHLDAAFIADGSIGFRLTDPLQRFYGELAFIPGVGTSGVRLDGHQMGDKYSGAEAKLLTKAGGKISIGFPIPKKNIDLGIALRVSADNTGTRIDPETNLLVGDKAKMEIAPAFELRYRLPAYSRYIHSSLIFYWGLKIDASCPSDSMNSLRCALTPQRLPNIKVEWGGMTGFAYQVYFSLPPPKPKSPPEEKIWRPSEEDDRYIPAPQPQLQPNLPLPDLSGTVLFDFGRAELKLNSATVDWLGKVADTIATYKLLVRVEGYASEEGSPSYNLRLSQRRAEAVRDYLLQDPRLKDHIVEARGYGVIRGETVEERTKNRQVKFFIVRD